VPDTLGDSYSREKAGIRVQPSDISRVQRLGMSRFALLMIGHMTLRSEFEGGHMTRIGAPKKGENLTGVIRGKNR